MFDIQIMMYVVVCAVARHVSNNMMLISSVYGYNGKIPSYCMWYFYEWSIFVARYFWKCTWYVEIVDSREVLNVK